MNESRESHWYRRINFYLYNTRVISCTNGPLLYLYDHSNYNKNMLLVVYLETFLLLKSYQSSDMKSKNNGGWWQIESCGTVSNPEKSRLSRRSLHATHGQSHDTLWFSSHGKKLFFEMSLDLIIYQKFPQTRIPAHCQILHLDIT
jgi:hypothetical protein